MKPADDAPEKAEHGMPSVRATPYRVTLPIFAILTLEGERIPVTIPKNSYVYLSQGLTDSDKRTLVDVSWEGRVVAMFAMDVPTHTEIVQNASQA